jgi:hypothetical protein
MKFKAFLLSTLLSTTAFAHSPYELISVPHSEIDQHLTIGTDANGTPKNLQGLWWMDGNPLADEVISFAGTQWEEIVENGEVVGYKGTLPVYDEGVWSWHDSKAGAFLYSLVLKNRLTYVATFNKDFTHGVILPTVKPLGVLPTLTIPASMLVEFTMTQVDENEYSRDSILFGLPSQYRFRRLVDANGNRLPYFDEFVEKAEADNALLPICKNNANESLPTSCVR